MFLVHNAFTDNQRELAQCLKLLKFHKVTEKRTLFYQPSLQDFSSDYKVSALMSLNIPISEKILVEVQISTALDNDPPDISKKSNHSFSTNFRYTF